MCRILGLQAVGTLICNNCVIAMMLSDRPHRWQLPTRYREWVFMEVVPAFDSPLVIHPHAKVDVTDGLSQLNLELFLLLICETFRSD